MVSGPFLAPEPASRRHRSNQRTNHMDYDQQEYADIEPALDEAIPASDEAQEDVAEPQEPQEPSAPAPEGDENDDLPQEPDKQREAWIKARQKIRDQEAQLRAIEAQKQQEQNAQPPEEDDGLMDQLMGWQPPVARPTSQLDLSDPYNRAVQEHLTAAQDEAGRANARTAALESKLERMEAESAYPQMRTDRRFKERVDEKMIALTLKAQARSAARPSLAQVAKRVDEEMRQYGEVAGAQAVERTREERRAAETAGVSARGGTANVEAPRNDPGLSRRINKGDSDALTRSLMEGELSRFSEKDLGFY